MKTLRDKYQGKERQKVSLTDIFDSFRLKDIGKALASLALGLYLSRCSDQSPKNDKALYNSAFNKTLIGSG